MEKPGSMKLKVNTEQYTVLSPVPPYVDIILEHVAITPHEFAKIADLALSYQNDPRLVEMVRKAGDASAKVPYLLDEHETAHSILECLREIAQPHIQHLNRLPDPVQSTIRTLLSINTVPGGCDIFCIPALLEIDRMQSQMVAELQKLMAGRKQAKAFHESNLLALKLLDQDWPQLLHKKNSMWPEAIPATPRMQYKPVFIQDRFVRLYETCAIVEAPEAHVLKRLTPAILHRPIHEHQAVPTVGSADWLIREIGKIGRHFTRALIGIILTHLEDEKISLEAQNYEEINLRAMDALREYIEKRP
jgi:hypothetical protein